MAACQASDNSLLEQQRQGVALHAHTDNQRKGGLMGYFKTGKQPLCRCCGKPIAKVATTVYIEKNPDFTRPLANWSRHIFSGMPVLNKADCQRHTNQTIVSLGYTSDYNMDTDKHDNRRVRWFTEWDGETYKDKYFCTVSCAQSFGRLAAQHTDLHTVAYHKATQRELDKAE